MGYGEQLSSPNLHPNPVVALPIKQSNQVAHPPQIPKKSAKMFSFGHHGQNQPVHPPAGAPGGGGVHQPTFKIFCKADKGYCLTIRDNVVILAPANRRDEHQHWIKDMHFSTQIKDEEGNPSFAIVNKATGLAIKHSLAQSQPVKLVPFSPVYLDESVMWSESGDIGEGFSCIRMLNNIHLNFDAFHGDKDRGGVHDGTTVVLSEWVKSDNQSWKILPWGDEAYAGGSDANATRGGGGHKEPTVRIFCKADEGYSVTVHNGIVCLAPTNPRDEYQHWIKDMRHSNSIKDEEGYPAFVLVNKATGFAIKHSLSYHPVKVVPFNPEYLDETLMWTESGDVEEGFSRIRMVNNIHLNFDAFHGDKDRGGVHDGTTVVLWGRTKGDNQSWKILPWGNDAYAGGSAANAPHGHAPELQAPAAAVRRVSAFQLMLFTAAVIVGAAGAPVAPPRLLAAFVVWLIGVIGYLSPF